MRISISWLRRQVACCLVTLLVAPLAEAATTLLPVPLPDSPGAAQAADQNQQTAVSPGSAANQQSTGNRQSTGNQQSTGAPPVGTAAAPYVEPGGVAASRPAGAAIAPAKQRRTRSFAIKVGLLVGAGIAIGVVTAVSLNSPSRPH